MAAGDPLQPLLPGDPLRPDDATLAALAKGESKIIRPLRADDTDRLLEALCTLGAEARWDGDDVYIKGVNGRFPRGGNLYMVDGGTPTRFMIACACLAAEPVTIGEREIPAGAQVIICLAAANRDMDRYASPETLDIDRDVSRHLAFGHGIHHCLGAPLARMEGRIGLE